MNEYTIIFGYVLFLSIVGLFLNAGAPSVLENAPVAPVTPNYTSFTTPPTYPSGSSWWDFITGALDRAVFYIGEIIIVPILFIIQVMVGAIYFVSLMGVASIQYPWLGAVLGAYTVVVFYIILRLVKPFGS